MLRPLVVIGCFAAATVAIAEPSHLTGQSIRTTLSGATIAIDTPAGTTIPVRISRDGLVSGQAGELASYLGAAKDRGRWWVAGDHLCVKWFRWFEAKPRCISLSQDGSRLYWRDQSGETGTATITAKAEPPKAPRPIIAKTKVTTTETKTAAKDTAPEPPRLQRAGMSAAFQKPARQQPESTPNGASAATPQVLNSGASEPVAEPPATAAAEAEPQKQPAPFEVANIPVPQQAPPRSKREIERAPEAAVASSAYDAVPVLFRVAGVADDDILNVRAGPSQSYPPVGEIPPRGRRVHITGECRGAWCPIRHGRVRGWVNRYYLAEDRSAAAMSR
jgi:SH3 domain-containing protein